MLPDRDVLPCTCRFLFIWRNLKGWFVIQSFATFSQIAESPSPAPTNISVCFPNRSAQVEWKCSIVFSYMLEWVFRSVALSPKPVSSHLHICIFRCHFTWSHTRSWGERYEEWYVLAILHCEQVQQVEQNNIWQSPVSKMQMGTGGFYGLPLGMIESPGVLGVLSP